MFHNMVLPFLNRSRKSNNLLFPKSNTVRMLLWSTTAVCVTYFKLHYKTMLHINQFIILAIEEVYFHSLVWEGWITIFSLSRFIFIISTKQKATLCPLTSLPLTFISRFHPIFNFTSNDRSMTLVTNKPNIFVKLYTKHKTVKTDILKRTSRACCQITLWSLLLFSYKSVFS